MVCMSIDKTLQIISEGLEDTLSLGEKIGQKLKGGEVIELVGDVGSGKTVFVRGLAKGAGSSDSVASPSFTISRVYNCDDFTINHFDFYRLEDAGLMKAEITDVIGDERAVVAVEWSDIVSDVMPSTKVNISFTVTDEDKRKISIRLSQELEYLLGSL